MSTFGQDVRYALRSLGKSPGFAASAILILALGIGANTAIFSVVDSVVLHPLPAVGHPGGLVDLTGGGGSYPAYLATRKQAGAFEGLAAWRERELNLATGGGAERILGAVVSANYFDVLEVRPSSGRFFLPAEEESGDPVAVLSQSLWKSRFGSDAAALGGTIQLNGVAFTVVGVAPAGFRGTGFGSAPDLWVPIAAWPRLATGEYARLDLHNPHWGWLSTFGRLKPGVARSQAQTELDLITAREASAFGEAPEDMRVRLMPTIRTAAGFGGDGAAVQFLALLVAAVAVALLIACANLANLLLARAAARQKEIAVRQALGASRGRLFRQLLTESVMLAVLGGVAGLLVANWSLGILLALPMPGDFSLSMFGAALNLRALAFSFLLSVLTGVVFGLFPALAASRTAVATTLRAAAAISSPRSRLKNALVAAQVALCLLLLVVAGLLTRSLRGALAIDLGFQPRGVTLASVNLGLQRYDGPRAAAFLEELPRRLASSPGVRSATWASILPLSGGGWVETVSIEGYAPRPGEKLSIDVDNVAPRYFRTMEIPIVSGREFEDRDREGSAPVAIVNEAMARRFWPGISPLGRRMHVDVDRTVVGVVRDSRFQSLREAATPQVYLPLSQLSGGAALGMLTLLVRADLPPGEVASRLRGEVKRLDPVLPVTSIGTYEETLGAQLLPQRVGSALLGLFGVLSLVLAVVGIYAVVSFSVARRTREIGIRMALGARPADVRSLVVGQSASPLVTGLAIGLLLGAGAARLLQGFLYGVGPSDPPTFMAVTALLGLCGLVAAWLPARRASQIDPISALRSE